MCYNRPFPLKEAGMRKLLRALLTALLVAALALIPDFGTAKTTRYTGNFFGTCDTVVTVIG
mgnify:CR=1 FL=1